MILTSRLFDTFDRCERRLALERTHELLTISPLGLLYAAVEAAMVAPDPARAASDAVMEITSRLKVNVENELSPISTVRHVQSMAEVIGLALRAKFIVKATKPDLVPLGDDQWQSGLFEIRGELYRLILTAHMDDDSLRSFAHSWQTIGELAAMQRRVTLLVVIVGAQHGGRRHSPWAKGWLHPINKSSLRFAPRKRDDGFTANWTECWRERTTIGAQTWLNRMQADEVLDGLISTRRIVYNGKDERMNQAQWDMGELVPLLATARADAPMRRSSCDEVGRGACPWQPYCYSSTPVSLDALGYMCRPREAETPHAAPASGK